MKGLKTASYIWIRDFYFLSEQQSTLDLKQK